ncbi:MAG: UDP-N-acetylmuramoyl-L-alanine--D-glutamate ligase [Planctomycetota bacterium]|nr:UDP-N-acetylmuramoyl-L-alanine--D-glutamate ligase [Planctomycetota bacterium]
MTSSLWSPLPELRGARVAVVGLGRFGGSLGAIRWLAAQGARIHVSDRASASRLAESLDSIAGLVREGHVTVRTDSQDPSDIEGAALVVASAAVPMPWQNALLTQARAAGSIVTTEIALALRELEGVPTIAVTGSAGKSTTTSLVDEGIRAAGVDAWLGGNIGGSLLDRVLANGPRPEWLVLELSSAQLWWLSAQAREWGGMGTARWAPTIGVLTNLAPNHVDWHGSLQHYVQSKAGIVPEDGGASRFLSAQDAARTAALRRHLASEPWWPLDPSRLPEPPALHLAGAHNRENAALAIAALEAVAQHRSGDQHSGARDGAARFDHAAARAAIARFRGLPHRLEFVGEHDGLRFYNDSKSTTPASTRLAIAAFPDPARIHLIAGGYDKGIDLQSLRDLGPQLAGLYAIGQTGSAIALPESWSDCATLDTAVQRACARAQPGDIILLSPGCASWDQFRDFEARGEAFAALCQSSRDLVPRADTMAP